MKHLTTLLIVAAMLPVARQASARLATVYVKPAEPAAVPVSTATVAALDDHAGKIAVLSSRVDVLEHVNPAPVNIYVRKARERNTQPLPAATRAMLETNLDPQIADHIKRIDAGSYNQEDIAFVVAGYNTNGDHAALTRFCKRMLTTGMRVGTGMRMWLTNQCVGE